MKKQEKRNKNNKIYLFIKIKFPKTKTQIKNTETQIKNISVSLDFLMSSNVNSPYLPVNEYFIYFIYFYFFSLKEIYDKSILDTQIKRYKAIHDKFVSTYNVEPSFYGIFCIFFS